MVTHHISRLAHIDLEDIRLYTFKNLPKDQADDITVYYLVSVNIYQTILNMER